ncbi:SEDS family protein MrdB [Candidatus Magnetomoraceae bacterium gMMP-15]
MVMFDRRLIQSFDWVLLIITLALIGVGLTALYSVVHAEGALSQSSLYIKQILWVGVGLVVMLFFLFFNYKLLDRWHYLVYGGCIGLLIAVLFFGRMIAGSKRWLVLGPVSIQASEVAKIAIIIILARYYSRFASEKGLSLKELLIPFIYTAIPCIFILTQPDLGTTMVLLLIAGSITLFVKIRKGALIFLITVCAIAVTLLYSFLLEDYQRQRLSTFINPGSDPLGSGYHIIQSKIAIGSGMLTGKGFLKGTQNALSFLPEQHTDFIFSVFAEEWGFSGGCVIILLYLWLIVWGLRIANISRDPFGKILAVGVCAMIFWQVVINIGMVMGLMPVVGVPLPFISYGGSSVVTTMLGVGILLNISMRKFMFD